MPDLSNSRRKLKIAIGTMLAADVLAVAVLFSPLVGSADSRKLEINELRAQLTKKNREMEPLRNVDKKLVLAQAQIADFYKVRFAAQDSELLKQLGTLATENGIRMEQAKYKQEDAETPGVIPVEIEGSFSGDYLQLVRFINTLERSTMFFEVDGVELAGESTGAVKLQIAIHSFLR